MPSEIYLHLGFKSIAGVNLNLKKNQTDFSPFCKNLNFVIHKAVRVGYMHKHRKVQ